MDNKHIYCFIKKTIKNILYCFFVLFLFQSLIFAEEYYYFAEDYHLLESQVANISGLITQTTILNQVFSDIDNIRQKRTNYYSSSKNKFNLYAATSDVVFENNNRIESGLWIRPFLLNNDIQITKNSSNLCINEGLIGLLAGVDLAIGKSGLLSFYLGYAGSSQGYEEVRIKQRGYILGVTGMIIKENGYAGITANINFNKAESQSDYGTNNFNMNMYSIGAKAGYNFDLSEKFILEPNLTLMCGKVNNQNYEMEIGTYVDEIGTMNMIFEPQVKAKLNLTNGWQPYALLGYLINMGEESKLTVNSEFIDARGIRSFGEYGLGVNKLFNSAWSCYLQVICKGGDLSGIGGNLGIKYSFLTQAEKENIEMIKHIKKKEAEEKERQKALEEKNARIEKEKIKEEQRLEREEQEMKKILEKEEQRRQKALEQERIRFEKEEKERIEKENRLREQEKEMEEERIRIEKEKEQEQERLKEIYRKLQEYYD